MKKYVTLLFILALVPYSVNAQASVSCDWNKTCAGNNLVRTADCLVNNTQFDFVENIYCDQGCENGTDNQFGSQCIGDKIICDNQTLPFMDFGSDYVLALGLMLMLVGAGTIGNNILLSQTRKQKRDDFEE